MAEKIVTIPLKDLSYPRAERANRAIRDIKDYLYKHEKASEVRISKGVNDIVWARGKKKPPASVKVKVKLEGGTVFASLPEEKEVVKKTKEEPKGLVGKAKQITGKEEGKPKEEKQEEPKAGQGKSKMKMEKEEMAKKDNPEAPGAGKGAEPRY